MRTTRDSSRWPTLALFAIFGVAFSASAGCASELAPTPQASSDAGSSSEDGGAPQHPPVDAAAPHVFVLTIDGKDVPLDPKTFKAWTSHDGRHWGTTISAAILGAENYPWNATKKPLLVSLYGKQSKSTALPIGTYPCTRGSGVMPEDNGGYFHAQIVLDPQSPYKPTVLEQSMDEATCTTHFEQWMDWQRGSISTTMTPPESPSEPHQVMVTWSLPQKLAPQ